MSRKQPEASQFEQFDLFDQVTQLEPLANYPELEATPIIIEETAQNVGSTSLKASGASVENVPVEAAPEVVNSPVKPKAPQNQWKRKSAKSFERSEEQQKREADLKKELSSYRWSHPVRPEPYLDEPSEARVRRGAFYNKDLKPLLNLLNDQAGRKEFYDLEQAKEDHTNKYYGAESTPESKYDIYVREQKDLFVAEQRAITGERPKAELVLEFNVNLARSIRKSWNDYQVGQGYIPVLISQYQRSYYSHFVQNLDKSVLSEHNPETAYDQAKAIQEHVYIQYEAPDYKRVLEQTQEGSYKHGPQIPGKGKGSSLIEIDAVTAKDYRTKLLKELRTYDLTGSNTIAMNLTAQPALIRQEEIFVNLRDKNLKQRASENTGTQSVETA